MRIGQVPDGVRCLPHLQVPQLIIRVAIAARSDCWRSQSRHSWARRVRTMLLERKMVVHSILLAQPRITGPFLEGLAAHGGS